MLTHESGLGLPAWARRRFLAFFAAWIARAIVWLSMSGWPERDAAELVGLDAVLLIALVIRAPFAYWALFFWEGFAALLTPFTQGQVWRVVLMSVIQAAVFITVFLLPSPPQPERRR